MKKISSIILAIVMTLSLTATAFAANKIFVDLVEVKTDTPPTIINGRTMVPVRAITEMIGCRVEWIAESRQVEVYAPNSTDPDIIMQIGNKTAYYTQYEEELGENVGVEAVLDSPPAIVNNRTLVPLRFISEAIGYTVDWNVDSKDVYMFSPEYMENQIGEGKGEDIAAGEGIGETKPLSEEEINYVLSFQTKSWLELSVERKAYIVSLIGRWWGSVDHYIIEDYDAVLADIDHQMETYSRNNVNANVFETACEIYNIDVSNYVMG